MDQAQLAWAIAAAAIATLQALSLTVLVYVLGRQSAILREVHELNRDVGKLQATLENGLRKDVRDLENKVEELKRQ